MTSIKKLTLFIKIAVLVTLCIDIIGIFSSWFLYTSIKNTLLISHVFIHPGDYYTISLLQKILGFSINILGYSLFVYSMYLLLIVTDEIGYKEFFSKKASELIARSTKYLAIWFMSDHLLIYPLSVLAATIHKPQGQKMIGLALGNTSFHSLVTILIIALISHLINEGYKIKTENSLVI